jgi:hypothetical protein
MNGPNPDNDHCMIVSVFLCFLAQRKFMISMNFIGIGMRLVFCNSLFESGMITDCFEYYFQLLDFIK